ncbi:MAG: site-2 protease family protein [Bacillota bacterium]
MFGANPVIAVLVIVIGVVFHEVAHGWMAKRLGDRTAERAGRLTLNPIPHLDPVGSIILPAALVLLNAGVVFGWAKPVPVNPHNFRGDIKRGMMLVSFAGPGSNLLLAAVGAVLLGLLMGLQGIAAVTQTLFGNFLHSLILINLVLAFLNLLPVPPLDGSKILAGILPGRQEWLYSLEKYGFAVLIVLLVTGAIGIYLAAVVKPAFQFLLRFAADIARFFGS